ncbi:hypothetical protein [Vibrio sp. Evd11]|uniref:hypothetical protein n=1 Tax=Vibrio sp. Evd11 TaxID=1207404 RepID=UPI000EFA4EC0|nr:hypothetical protein [Vibrio sp. Evd11]
MTIKVNRRVECTTPRIFYFGLNLSDSYREGDLYIVTKELGGILFISDSQGEEFAFHKNDVEQFFSVAA